MTKSFLNKLLARVGYVRAETWNHFSGFGGIFGSFKNSSKEKVTNENALTLSTVFACIRNISEDVAKLPLKVYYKSGGKRFEDTEHSLYRILQYQPNPFMTAISFREALQAHAMGWGNGYAEIERDVLGNVVGLYPLRPDRVSLETTESGQRFYRVINNKGGFVDLVTRDVLHVHGLGSDGERGYNIIQYAAQSIGSAMAMDKVAGSYFANGMNISGVLKHPNSLSKEAQQRLGESYKQYTGSTESGKMMVIEEGMDFTPVSIDPKNSQMIESRQFSITEFCRWMRIPPHKVADLSRATFTNIEEQNIDYVQDGLLGWLERWEQALWVKLLSQAEKQSGYYFQHVVEGLLRGNSTARYDGYTKLWDRGVLSINEIRAKEELNPIEGGDEHFVPANFVKLNDAGNDVDDKVIRDIANRIAKKEIKEIEPRIKYADTDEFKRWLVCDLLPKHCDFISKAILPLNIKLIANRLSMIPFLAVSDKPAETFENLKSQHSDFIYENIKGVLNG